MKIVLRIADEKIILGPVVQSWVAKTSKTKLILTPRRFLEKVFPSLITTGGKICFYFYVNLGSK